MHWASNAGLAISPFLVLATNSDFRGLFIADATTTALFGLGILLVMSESRPGQAEAADHPVGYRQVLRERIFMCFTLLTLLLATLVAQVPVTLPIAVRADHLPSRAYTIVIIVNTVMVIALQLPAIN